MLADWFGRENVKSKVIEEGYGSTSEAKAAETAKLEEHFEKYGSVPKGNQRSFKLKGDYG
ncbi:hypothetical protein [Methylomonas fluvii]|nr:hypothetical protein [Methylomonas fluvii]